MRIYLPRLRTTEWVDLGVDELEALAAKDRHRVHQLVDDPEDADVVLFVQCHLVDWRLTQILRSELARRYWAKAMVYDERDRPWLSLPGVYVSTPSSSFDPRRQRAWAYVWSSRRPRPDFPTDYEPDLLFSFVGSRTAACREAVLELRHPDAVIEDVADFSVWDSSSTDFEERRCRYDEVLTRSRFVLCPRGRGTSTFRLYETIAAGRVPVIISDEWVPPEGPRWDSFSLRVREDQIASLPAILWERSGDWGAMSAAASAACSEFFGEAATFHRVAELLDELRSAKAPTRGRRVTEGRGIAAAVRARLEPRRAVLR